MKTTRPWLSQALHRLHFQAFVRLNNADFVSDSAEKRAAQAQLMQASASSGASAPSPSPPPPNQREAGSSRSNGAPARGTSFCDDTTGRAGLVPSTYLRVREKQRHYRSVSLSREFARGMAAIRACEKRLSRYDDYTSAASLHSDGPTGEVQHATLAKMSSALHAMSVEMFSVGPTQDLISLLKILLRRPVSGRKFAACACFEQLAARSASLTGIQLVDALRAALVDNIVPTNVKRELVGNLVERLSSDAPPLLQDVSFLQLSRLVRYSVSASPEVLTAPVGQSLLVSTLRAVMHGDKEKSMTTAQVGQLVPFVQAIAHHRVPNDMALAFLRDAAPIVLAGLYDLSAHQLCDLLIAYASIGYRDVEWFVTLGQRAGELGEEMSDDDAGSVIRCFTMIGVDHVALRRSLESSLRMRNLGRRPMWHT